MKKEFLLLLFLSAFISCEQNDGLDYLDSSNIENMPTVGIKSRATQNIADFNPIKELENIPVNIMNVGNTRNRFLSCTEKGDKVDLYKKDDGSLRQRWYLSNFGIVLVGGHAGGTRPNSVYVITPKADTPIISESMDGMPICAYNFVPEGSSYYKIKAIGQLQGGGLGGGIISSPSTYLQAESSTGTSLKFKESATSNLALWEMQPVGDFEVVNIEYTQYDGGGISLLPITVTHRTVENTTSSIVHRGYTETTQVTETSRFSKTEGVSITTSTSLTKPVGGPGEPNEGSMTVNTSATSSWSFLQETTQTKVSTRTETFSVDVPPYTSYRITTMLKQYNMNIKYVATLREGVTGKMFKVKGTWTGTQVYDMYDLVEDLSTGRTFEIYGDKS